MSKKIFWHKVNQSPDLNLNPNLKKFNLNLLLIDERQAASIHFNKAETNISIDKIRISNTYSKSQNNVNCNGLF